MELESRGTRAEAVGRLERGTDISPFSRPGRVRDDARCRIDRHRGRPTRHRVRGGLVAVTQQSDVQRLPGLNGCVRRDRSVPQHAGQRGGVERLGACRSRTRRLHVGRAHRGHIKCIAFNLGDRNDRRRADDVARDQRVGDRGAAAFGIVQHVPFINVVISGAGHGTPRDPNRVGRRSGRGHAGGNRRIGNGDRGRGARGRVVRITAGEGGDRRIRARIDRRGRRAVVAIGEGAADGRDAIGAQCRCRDPVRHSIVGNRPAAADGERRGGLTHVQRALRDRVDVVGIVAREGGQHLVRSDIDRLHGRAVVGKRKKAVHRREAVANVGRGGSALGHAVVNWVEAIERDIGNRGQTRWRGQRGGLVQRRDRRVGGAESAEHVQAIVVVNRRRRPVYRRGKRRLRGPLIGDGVVHPDVRHGAAGR